jgi:DNA replication protein DnaC
MALAELEFIDRREVVHFLGPPGTGKSHLSLALGVQAVKAGRSVYFTPLSDLVSTLAKAEREGTLREKIRFFCRFSLLIVDEIGYLPVCPRSACACAAEPVTDHRTADLVARTACPVLQKQRHDQAT